MNDERVLLLAVRNEGEQWIADISFRGKSYVMTFQPDGTGRLRHTGRSPFGQTLEGVEVCVLVDRVRKGEALVLPYCVDPGARGSRMLSVHSKDWNDWSDDPGLKEVWLDAVERTGDTRWVAQLRLDGEVEVYELEILPGPTLHELRGPKTPSFQSYTFDLTSIILRMQNGARFALPFKLRPRWPTPPEPPALE